MSTLPPAPEQPDPPVDVGAERTLRSFYESAPLLMGIVDLPPDDSDILHVYDNPASERFFGLAPGSTAGRTASSLGVSRETVRMWIDHYRAAQREKHPVRFEYDHELPSGRVRLASTVNLVGPVPGGGTRFSYATEDVTAKTREVRRAASRLDLQAALVDAATPTAVLDVAAQHLLSQCDVPDLGVVEVDARTGRVTACSSGVGAAPGASAGHAGQAILHVHPSGATMLRVVAGAHADAAWSTDDRRWFGELLSLVSARLERVRAAQRLANQEARLRLALDAAYLISFEWDILRDEVRRLHSTDPVLGPTPDEAPSSFAHVRAVVHPDDRDRFTAAVQEALARPDGRYVNEFRITRPDGSAAYLFERGRVERDAEGRPLRLIGLSQDITPRVRAEQALTDSRAFLQSVFDGLGSAVAVIDDEGRIVATNAAWRRAAAGTAGREGTAPAHAHDVSTGTDVDEATGDDLGQRGDDLGVAYLDVCRQGRPGCPPADIVADDLAAVLTHRRSTFAREYQSPSSGPECWFLLRANRFDSGGTPRIVLSHEDITTAKRAELELRVMDRRKDEFIAILAHELRNPLAPIRHGAGVLKVRTPADPVLTRCAAIIERQVGHMARLLDDLLDVSRLSRGKLVLKRAPVRIAEILDAAIEASHPLIDAHQHHFELRAGEAAVAVDGDRERLVQVFTNLLTNAANYSPPQSRLTVEVTPLGDEVAVAVRDTGVGLAPDIRERVFELFSQGGSPHQATRRGLGIGLSLARMLVELHGGTIRAESEGVGRGSVFTVVLPVVAAPAETGQPAPGHEGQEHPAAEPGVPRRHVLVVDDNSDAADSLAMLLVAHGCHVQVAYDGPSALSRLDRFAGEVVFLDLGMPGMDGFEVCRHIKARRPRVRVVAVTGWGNDEARRRSAAAGFDAHLVKPVDSSALGDQLHLVV